MRFRRLHRLLVLSLAALLLLGDAAAEPQSSTDAVTAANLLASERFWPYQVALTEALPVPARGEPLALRTTGVLIRVEASGLARVDFGSAGKYELPVQKTDLLERANQIRRGELTKDEPNFVHAIKTRMLDSASEKPRGLAMEAVEGRRAYLCVFADPDAPDFATLAGALAPLREREDVLTILFPQGARRDPAVRERLRALKWTVPFLPGFLSEPYTKTLIREGAPLPYVLLQTSEGRVLFQGAWEESIPDALRSALSG